MELIYTTYGKVYKADHVAIHRGQVYFYDVILCCNDNIRMSQVIYIEKGGKNGLLDTMLQISNY